MLKYINLFFYRFYHVVRFGDGSKVAGSDESDVRCQNSWLQQCLPTLLYWIGLNFFSLKLKFGASEPPR